MWLLYIWCSSCCAWLSPTTFSNFDLAQNGGLKFLDRSMGPFFRVEIAITFSSLRWFKTFFIKHLECAGPKKKFFEDSSLKAQNSIANFDIKANEARHPLASTSKYSLSCCLSSWFYSWLHILLIGCSTIGSEVHSMIQLHVPRAPFLGVLPFLWWFF